MTTIPIKNIKKPNGYSVFTIVAILIVLFLYNDASKYIRKEYLYLLFTIFSSISIFRTARKAARSFQKIEITNNTVKFYFQFKLKDPIVLSIFDLQTTRKIETILFKRADSGKIIGEINKMELSNEEQWEYLVSVFSNSV